MKKSQHKIPASLMQTRIKQQVQDELIKIKDQQHDEFRRGYETASKDVTGLYKPKIDEQKQQLLDQAKRHQSRVEELKAAMQSAPAQILPMIQGEAMRLGFFVGNKGTSWKWFSNIAFALIVAVQAFYDALPPELITSLPDGTQSKITVALAILGFVGRYINQSKPKPLAPIEESK
ncbi:hypothetical protein [Acinetobacter gerneri]|uniref:Holin of 3TMs, for gene-transfer release n=1 Tax=Acinetobacter gerneri DSM 14967 = CIP 107464 = MTCC 9824 TaxID=1120926 RepID=N8YAY2_9GAMM|nr:hypothetical protein [Acinetobacter gerneri]ENV33937.1 hypothetical protein F960_01943 [Acinetobacter gerneri DSM 14967 = CIP 107464 = MTCC 9824]EPR82814.1 hypothetical protein L289_2732 [Acinetobacter gerneri DSM 14967 = CIP 107464 = MTCC 9824]MDV2438688.1 hypothetical protein [Acinetobacter gerneri]